MLVVLVNMLELPDVAENGRLRVIELFAGIGNIWRVAKKRGLVACLCILKPLCSIFKHCLLQIYSLSIFAKPCSTCS